MIYPKYWQNTRRYCGSMSIKFCLCSHPFCLHIFDIIILVNYINIIATWEDPVWTHLKDIFSDIIKIYCFNRKLFPFDHIKFINNQNVYLKCKSNLVLIYSFPFILFTYKWYKSHIKMWSWTYFVLFKIAKKWIYNCIR